MSVSIRPIVLGAALLCAASAFARQGEPPYSLQSSAKLARLVPTTELAPIDAAARRIETDTRERNRIGLQTKRLAVADPRDTSLTPLRDGSWETLPDGSRLWRARVRVPGATDLRLVFSRYDLPAGAQLHVIGAGGYYQGPYLAGDRDVDGRFEAPVLPGETATIELRVPATAWPLAAEALRLDRVGAGFRDLFRRQPPDPAKSGSPGSSGSCNINAACPLGQPYADESRAVAYFEFRDDDGSGWYRCTGTLLNNTGATRHHRFLTAAHCVDSASEASTMMVYWNYRSTQCNQLTAPPGGWFNDNQNGATLRAMRADTDLSLVELRQAPLPEWQLYYAGWDAGSSAPPGTIGLHHPAGDVLKITAGPTPSLMRNCIVDNPLVRDTHWRTGPYSQGTTEGGSSGSALFVPSGANAGKRVIGALSGGDAECVGTRPNAGIDCYGRVAAAWNGNTPDTRLRDWLDPTNSGVLSLDGIDAAAAPPAFLPRSHRPLPPILRQRPPRR